MGCLERQELLCGSFGAALRLHTEAEDPASHLGMAADRNRLCSLLGLTELTTSGSGITA